MGFFDEKAFAGRFINSEIPQQNLHGFSNLWAALTSGDKLKGAFFFAVNVDAGDLGLAVWIAYYETPQTHCYLVIDGPFLSMANIDEIRGLLNLTEEFQGKLLASGCLPIADAGQKVFYCKYPACDTADLLDALEAAQKLSDAWLKTNWQNISAEAFLRLFERERAARRS